VRKLLKGKFFRDSSPRRTKAVIECNTAFGFLSCRIVVSGCIVTVHINKGFFVQNGRYEYTLVLGVGALSVTFTGAGSLSLDALLGHSMRGALCGVAAFFVGLLGGGIQLARRPAPQGEPQKNHVQVSD